MTEEVTIGFLLEEILIMREEEATTIDGHLITMIIDTMTMTGENHIIETQGLSTEIIEGFQEIDLQETTSTCQDNLNLGMITENTHLIAKTLTMAGMVLLLRKIGTTALISRKKIGCLDLKKVRTIINLLIPTKMTGASQINSLIIQRKSNPLIR